MRAAEQAALQGKVLHVDRNSVRLKLRAESLRDAGFQVIEAPTSAEAPVVARDESAAVVLLDVSAPEDFDVCRRLRASAPVVCISAKGTQEENLPLALECGAAAYLHEPVQARLLEATLRAVGNRERVQRQLADAIPQVVFRTYPDGSLAYVNRWALEYFGLSERELPGVNWLHLIHRDDHAMLLARWAEALRIGEPFEEEHRLRRVDGQYRWHLNRVLPVRDGDGLVTGWIGTATDIHENKLLEQELRESQHFTAAMIDAAPWMVYVYDLIEHRNVFASAHSESLLGYPVDEYRAMGSGFLRRLMHPDDHERLTEHASRIAAAADNEVLELEYRLRNGSGEWRWMHSRDVVFKRDEQGVPVQVLGVVLDITERKQRQQRLEREEETQRFLADLSIRLSRTRDPEELLAEASEELGRFLGVNRCAFNEVDIASDRATVYRDYHSGLPSIAGVYSISVFGQESAEQLKSGKTVVICDARVDPRSAAVYEIAHAPIQVVSMIMTPLFRQGRWVACVSAGGPQPHQWTDSEVSLVEAVAERVWLLFENARLLRQTASALDTARETQRALEARTVELLRSNEDLQRFANFVSHDLQSPLRSISAFSQLVSNRYQGQLGAEGEEWLAFIRNGVGRMARLIQDLLDYSRATSVSRRAELSDCNRLLETALLNLQHSITESAAVITSDPLPALTVDPQLVRVFQNLIDNAIKYRSAGRMPKIQVAARREGHHWLFSVQDNGIGFDMRHADRIFRIFQQLHSEGEFEGTGIGLAVCKQVIERDGGKIWAESVPGQGSTFFFTVNPEPGAVDLR